MEINVATKMFKCNIFILSKDVIKKRYKMVSSYVFDNNARNVFLVYDGVHYNYLKVLGFPLKDDLEQYAKDQDKLFYTYTHYTQFMWDNHSPEIL